MTVFLLNRHLTVVEGERDIEKDNDNDDNLWCTQGKSICRCDVDFSR